MSELGRCHTWKEQCCKWSGSVVFRAVQKYIVRTFWKPKEDIYQLVRRPCFKNGMLIWIQKGKKIFFFEAKREHTQVTKSKLAPLQRRSVLDDLVLSLKSLKSSCLFHIRKVRIRCWAEFKRRMINFWITFWLIISELTKTVLLKGKSLKNIFFLKRRSCPFHTLKRRTTNVKFCVGLLKPKENMFELVRQPCFEFEKLLCFPLYIPRVRMRCWFEFEREMVHFWTMFQSIIWKKKHLKNNLRSITWYQTTLTSIPQS